MISYFIGFIVNPSEAARRIAEDRANLRCGFFFMLTFCIAYSLVALVYSLLGHLPVARSPLSVPPEKWYLVQTFTTLPVGFAGTLSYAALAYMLSRAMGGRGSFDATFASQSFTTLIPTLIFMWIPEALYAPFRIARGASALPWPVWVETLRVFILPLAWTLAISAVALRQIHRIHLLKSFFIVLASSIPMTLIMFVFIR
jgi:hypothetical protein